MAGFVDQRAGDGDALALAAGELRRPVRRPVGEVHDVERGHRALRAGLLRRHAGDQQRQLDVLDGGEDRQQVVELEDEAHPLRAVARSSRRRTCVPMSAPSTEMRPPSIVVEAGEAVEQGRLAAAGRPHDRDHLAAVDRQIDAAQGLRPADVPVS